MARGLNFGFRKNRDCTICVAKTKALISFAVTAKLICIFVFTYAKSRFSHDAAHYVSCSISGHILTGLFSCNNPAEPECSSKHQLSDLVSLLSASGRTSGFEICVENLAAPL